MTDSDKLAEQRITQHESHLQHIDELMKRAHTSTKQSAEENAHKEELKEIKQERDKFADYVEELKQKSPEQLMQTGGPMVMWELIAQRLEKLVERIGKGK